MWQRSVSLIIPYVEIRDTEAMWTANMTFSKFFPTGP